MMSTNLIRTECFDGGEKRYSIRHRCGHTRKHVYFGFYVKPLSDWKREHESQICRPCWHAQPMGPEPYVQGV